MKMKTTILALVLAGATGGSIALSAQRQQETPRETRRPGEMRPMTTISCTDLRDVGDVTVEQTERGAVIRMTAREQGQVQRIQQMAQMMRSCALGEQPGRMRNGNDLPPTNGNDVQPENGNHTTPPANENQRKAR
jgi:hypothetical protein